MTHPSDHTPTHLANHLLRDQASILLFLYYYYKQFLSPKNYLTIFKIHLVHVFFLMYERERETECVCSNNLGKWFKLRFLCIFQWHYNMPFLCNVQPCSFKVNNYEHNLFILQWDKRYWKRKMNDCTVLHKTISSSNIKDILIFFVAVLRHFHRSYGEIMFDFWNFTLCISFFGTKLPH